MKQPRGPVHSRVMLYGWSPGHVHFAPDSGRFPARSTLYLAIHMLGSVPYLSVVFVACWLALSVRNLSSGPCTNPAKLTEPAQDVANFLLVRGPHAYLYRDGLERGLWRLLGGL